MILKSSISQTGRLTVCPNESVLYECFVIGAGLLWVFPDVMGMDEKLYIRSDNINEVSTVGQATVWLSMVNNTHLMSRLVLSYSPKFNDTIITCKESVTEIGKRLKYITAGTLSDCQCIGEVNTATYIN